MQEHAEIEDVSQPHVQEQPAHGVQVEINLLHPVHDKDPHDMMKAREWATGGGERRCRCGVHAYEAGLSLFSSLTTDFSEL